MAPCISLSYLSTSALVYFNFVINTLVFSNSNPSLRLISLSSACVMVSAFVQLMRASYKCGRRCGAVFCGHDRVQTYGAIFTSRQVKEPILRSLKPQKSPAVQEDRSGYFGGRGDFQAGGLCIAPCQSADCAAGISVSVCLRRALDHLLQPAKTFAAVEEVGDSAISCQKELLYLYWLKNDDGQARLLSCSRHRVILNVNVQESR
ncbi:hypothetical protein Cgig2_018306 [Carnegiea gigantea]|uniref:Uncharacterized protein n=1 Tax=Carnegiea gigantea TaxID=171969 RepID=A0A9Q1KXV2_9CARY|nr:hypothetical protein Cgig2_018306 [Carnegiea gigantea]